MGQLLERRSSDVALHDTLVICSWNIRGLTDLKLFELVLHMKRYNIDILCIQETHNNAVAAYEEQGAAKVVATTAYAQPAYAAPSYVAPTTTPYAQPAYAAPTYAAPATTADEQPPIIRLRRRCHGSD